MTSKIIDKSKHLKVVKLINVNGISNNNKYWCCWMMPNGDLYVEHGRIGAKKPGTHTYETGSISQAEIKLNSLIREKARKGYVEAAVVEENEENLDWSILGNNASTIEQAIERLDSIGRQVNPYSQIRFNKSKGTFESNLGKISETTIDKAQKTLSVVARNVRNPQSPAFREAAENYLKIIQIPVGMKLDLVNLLGNQGKVRKQQEILNLLSEGLKLIALTRQQILELAAEIGGNGRSAWMRWGEAETSEEESPSCEGERSRFISWS